MEGGVRDIGQQLARDDHQFLQRNQLPAFVGRRHLSDIYRHRCRRAANRYAENQAEENHPVDVRREGSTHRADSEDHRQPEDDFLSACGAGQMARKQCAECGAEQQRAGHQPGGKRREVQFLTHKQQGAGNHPGVVAKE